MLHDNKYPKQRGINTRRVDQYRRDILAQNWAPGTTIKFAKMGQETYLINGQHRLESIILAGAENKDLQIEMVIVDMEVDTEEELGRLYYNEDMGLPRSIGQMFRSMDVGDKLGVPDYLARRAGHAINFIYAGWVHTKHAGLTKDEILQALLERYSDALPCYRNAVSTKVGGLYSQMWRSSVSALGLEIYRYAVVPDDDMATFRNMERANDFWLGVVTDDGLRLGDPRKVAHDHIVTSSMSENAGNSRVTRGYQSRFLAACWNTWYEGETFTPSKTGYVRISDPSAPIRILGTPWDGERTKPQD